MHGHTRNAERWKGMLEYYLVAVVVGLIVLFAMSRLGGADSRRYDCSNRALETAKISDGQSLPNHLDRYALAMEGHAIWRTNSGTSLMTALRHGATRAAETRPPP
jgi:hypothetical protein